MSSLKAPNIVPLGEVPHQAVERLLDAAFGADRFERTAYKIRAGMPELAHLSFAALDADGAFLGSIQCWPVALNAEDGSQTPLVMVGPVAVSPEYQRGGIGRALMRAMLDAAQKTKSDPLVMIGDPEYYGRFFNFEAAATQAWTADGPFEQRRLLVLNRENVFLPPEGRLGPRR